MGRERHPTCDHTYQLRLCAPLGILCGVVHSALPITKKKYAEILLHYRQLFIKGNVIIGKWGIFGMEIFLRYSRFFIKSKFIIDGAECIRGCPIERGGDAVLLEP